MHGSTNAARVFLVILGVFVVGIGVSCVTFSIPPRNSPDEWPTSTPEAQGIDSRTLLSMGRYIEGSGEDIHSILVIRHGRLVFEAYVYPYRANNIHMLASCTKSFTATVMGIAIDKGYIKGADQSVLDFFPEYRVSDYEAKKAIRLSDLLSMSSGLFWPSGGPGDATSQMNRSLDWIGFVLNRPVESPPGTVWNYNNGTSHLLSAIIERATGKKTSQFAGENLFDPMGFSDVEWESNAQGTTIGCAALYLRPRDMAKLGQLYLNRGTWNGKRIVSAEWIDDSLRKHSGEEYGYQWWIDPDLGLFRAWGYGGQHIAIIPALDMVVVFTGGISDNSRYPLHHALYGQFIIPAARSEEALPEDPQAYADLRNWADMINGGPEPRAVLVPPGVDGGISGKTFHFPANAMNLQSLSLTFGPSGADAVTEIRSTAVSGKFPLGLDGRYRVTTNDGLGKSYALRGSWQSADTFTIDCLNIDFGYRYSFSCRFTPGAVEVQAKAVIENINATVSGSPG